jgi:glucose-1-phosphate thymidylyltransferase
MTDEGAMKALVLSGGMGTRLRPFTHSMPKQLMSVANKPVLLHCLERIREIGVVDVGLVVGDRAEQIERFVGDGSSLGLRVTYIRQSAPLGLAHCVRIAGGFLGTDDFVMYLGDNVLTDGLTEIADSFRTHRPAAQVLVTKVAEPRDYGVVELDADGRVLGLEEKPERPRSNLVLIGVYFFTAAIHDAVRQLSPSARGELEITDAIQHLVDTGHPVTAASFTGEWRDIGSVDCLLECNRLLLDEVRPTNEGAVHDSEIRGAVVIEPGARVIGSRIDGPAVVGTGTVVRDSRVGPYAAIGKHCTLTGAGIEDSIALDGAVIDGVTGISGSLLGRGAVVWSTGRPGVRLLLGDHSCVDVASSC